MQPNYRTRETIRERLLRDASAIATLLADPRYGGQVLERLPSGEYAWLRPEHHPVRIVEPVTDPEPDEALFWPTEKGRRYLLTERLFTDVWPTVAEVANDRRIS